MQLLPCGCVHLGEIWNKNNWNKIIAIPYSWKINTSILTLVTRTINPQIYGYYLTIYSFHWTSIKRAIFIFLKWILIHFRFSLTESLRPKKVWALLWAFRHFCRVDAFISEKSGIRTTGTKWSQFRILGKLIHFVPCNIFVSYFQKVIRIMSILL